MNVTEGPVVRRIFSDYLSGLGSKRIANALNGQGVPTKNGKRWAGQMIRYILRTPLYCGYGRWEGHIKLGNHPALVGVGDFNRVQALVASRTKVPYQRREPIVIPEGATA
jgi:hypothetical protein